MSAPHKITSVHLAEQALQRTKAPPGYGGCDESNLSPMGHASSYRPAETPFRKAASLPISSAFSESR